MTPGWGTLALLTNCLEAVEMVAMRALWLCVLVACRIGFDPLATISPEQGRRAIALGSNHGCVIRDEAIYCWGLNDEFQVGDPALGVRTAPRAVEELPTIPIALAAGGAHTCFLGADENVYCWGANGDGQAGPRPVFEDSPAVMRVTGLPPEALDIAAGSTHTCSRHRNGTVWCWGTGTDGQAGPHSVDNQVPPQQVTGVQDVAIIAAGGNTTCALSASGVVSCWGQNDYGQLGDGTTTARAEPRAIAGLTATGIGLGDSHACALNMDGAYQCWGSDLYGELGDGTFGNRSLPNPPSPQRGLIAIDGGQQFTCAVDSQGVASCWGISSDGQVGSATRGNTALAPLTVNAGGPVAAVSTGGRTACAIRRDGEIACWGFGAHGQVGDGRSTATVPERVPLTGVRMISAGEHNTCAVHGSVAAESVSCWGDNRSNVAGTTGELALTPTAIMRSWPGTVSELKVGGHHACVRTSNDQVWCWGNNGSGQLGDGTTDSTSVPRRAGNTTFTAVALLHHSSCAIRSTDNVAMCWGSNYYSELGNGHTIERTSPTPVVTLGGQLHAVGLAAGSYHVCARDPNDEVLCWGNNDRLQTGGSDGVSTIPIAAQVVLPVAAIELRGGGGSMCITGMDSSTICWGNNADYLLDETAPYYTLPVTVARPGLGLFGETMACDTLGNCWGGARGGQLGDGSWAPRATAAPAALPGPPTMMTVGYHHACAIVDGDAYCWGDNPDGQIGNGTPSNAYTPVTLAFP